MEYELWRAELFCHGAPYDPWGIEFTDEMNSIPLIEALDHLDRMLDDAELHNLFTPEQLVLGLSMAYSNCLTDFPFCYLEAGTAERRISGILNLRKL